MEYILELREELWSGEMEKVLAVVVSLLMLFSVITTPHYQMEMRSVESIGEITQTAYSILKEIPRKTEGYTVLEIPEEIEGIAVGNVMFEVQSAETECFVEEIDMENSRVEMFKEESLGVPKEIPIEEMEHRAAVEVFEDVGIESVEEEFQMMEKHVPTEEISNLIIGDSTKNNITTEKQMSAEAFEKEEIEKEEIEKEEIENLETTTPINEIENTVLEDSEESIIDSAIEVPKEENVTNQAFLIDESGMIYEFHSEFADLCEGYLALPTEGCTGIRREAFRGCTALISEIYIPSNIIDIEEGAMSELCSLEYIVAEPGHPAFITVDGVLYDVAGTALLAYPTARVGAYFVPEQIQTVSENAFLNTSLSIIDIRGCGLSANCLLNISESCSIIE